MSAPKKTDSEPKEPFGTIDAPEWVLFDSDKSDERETLLQLNFGYVTGRYFVHQNGHHEIDVRPTEGRPDRQESYINRDVAKRYLKMLNDFTPVSIAGIPATTGVISILGGASTSKSPMADFMSDGHVIHFGEPGPDCITRASVACAELIEALVGRKQIVALDSVKNLLSRAGGGAASARGVSRAVFPMLSDWSSVSSALGKTLVIPVNPSTDDASAMAEIKEAMQSNVAMAVFALGGNGYNFLTRTPNKGKRIDGRLTATFEGNSIKRVAVNGATRLVDESELDDAYVSGLAAHIVNTREGMNAFKTFAKGE